MRREALRISGAWFGVTISLVLLAFFSKTSEDYSRRVVAGWFVLAPLAIIFLHMTRRAVLGYIRSQGGNSRSVAIVGMNEMGQRLVSSISEMSWLGYNVVGFYDDRVAKGEDGRLVFGENTAVCGGFNELIADSKAGKVDIIYITLPLRAEQRIKTLLGNLADSTVTVNIVPDFFVFDLLHSRWSTLQGLPVISVFDTPFTLVDGLTKRVEDVVLGSMIALVIAIPMVFIAIAVKLTSPGPVLFKQKRYGVHGEAIEVWKFRSMSVMEDGADVLQATKNDPRVTPLGAFLRKTSLDELPQFIHVLTGRMSIVGPRPHAVAHNEFYRQKIQGYMLRHKVKPGITGLAQINGMRGETETIEKMADRIRFDLDYIRHWSLGLDIKIIFKTIFKEFIFSKAY